MSRFVSINLAKLPALPFPERDFEATYAARIAELTKRLAAKGITFDTGSIDGDPLSAVEQAGAYREIIVLSARDDAIRALLLATSWGAFLDHIGAGQVPPVQRKALVAAPRNFALFPQDWESDEDFRARIQLAPEALSTCGSEGAYLFFALSTEGVKIASVYGPMSFGGTPEKPFAPLGEVHVPIVASPYMPAGASAPIADGTASDALVARVGVELSADERRPIADFVRPTAAKIEHYSIVANLKVGPGADADLVKGEAERRLQAQANRQHRAGAQQLRQMLYGQCYVVDSTGANLVEVVDLVSPPADVNAIPITPDTPDCAYTAPYCDSITVNVEVVND